jgi:hypothetical protein
LSQLIIKSYSERLFHFSELSFLDPPAAKQALVAPAASQGVNWTDEASERVLELSGCYPYFIQEFGACTWNVAQTNHIDLDAVEHGRVSAIAHLDAGFFKSRWDRATTKQKEYLTAMAAVETPLGSATSDIARRLDTPSNKLAPRRAELIARGLIYATRHGRVAFTVPGMGAFITRQQT